MNSGDKEFYLSIICIILLYICIKYFLKDGDD
jgi:hypothetical protein